MPYSVSSASEILREAIQAALRKYAFWYLVQGSLIAAVGVLAVLFPLLSSFAVIGAFGWMLILGGVLQAVTLIGSRSTQGYPLLVVSAVLFVVVGLIFLRNPADSLLTLGMLLIVLLFVQGISRIMFALSVRPLPNWVWVAASGAAQIGLAIFLWIGMPVTALWVLGLTLGTALIAEGTATAWLAWSLRQQGKHDQRDMKERVHGNI